MDGSDYDTSARGSTTPGENRTDFRGVSPPESESASDEGVMTPGLSERLLPAEKEPFLLGSSLSISSLSFPGNDVAGALWADLGVAGPLDVWVVNVDSEASDAEGASVALSAVGGRVVFFSDERGGGGERMTAEVDARRVWWVGRVRSWLCERGESTLRRL